MQILPQKIVQAIAYLLTKGNEAEAGVPLEISLVTLEKELDLRFLPKDIFLIRLELLKQGQLVFLDFYYTTLTMYAIPSDVSVEGARLLHALTAYQTRRYTVIIDKEMSASMDAVAQEIGIQMFAEAA